MPEWTRKERKEYIKKRYFDKRVKIFVLGVFFVFIIILLYAVVTSFQKGEYFLTFASILGLAVVIPIAIFWINIYLYEGD
jgi:lipopolysaccharide/colanic/teichoic acid biosynthesis glycosyltransferase